MNQKSGKSHAHPDAGQQFYRSQRPTRQVLGVFVGFHTVDKKLASFCHHCSPIVRDLCFDISSIPPLTKVLDTATFHHCPRLGFYRGGTDIR